MRIEFEIPGQPVAKGRPRFARRGNFVATYTPEKTVNYENLVKMAASNAMKSLAPTTKPVDVFIQLNLQIPESWSKLKKKKALLNDIRATKKPDIDNMIKAIKDGCNGIVWKDDSQVVSILAVKRYSEMPRAIVVIEEASGESA